VPELHLLDDEIEGQLRDAVARFVAERCGHKVATSLYDGLRSGPEDVWAALAYEMDLAGVLIPAELGGNGGSQRQAAVVMEELGRWVCPVPFLTSAVLATTALVHGGSQLAAALVRDRRTACLAVSFATAPDGRVSSVTADRRGRLTGSISSVAGLIEADVVLIPAVAHGRVSLYAIERRAVDVGPIVSLDMTRQIADLHVDQVPCEPVIADAEPAVRAGVETAAGLLASEQVGLAQWCFQTTVDYLKQRRQFGRVVGSYQAIKHRLANLYVAVEEAAATARYAAAALAEGDADVPVAVSTAQAYCSDVAVWVAEESIQLHGGIGMAWEYPLHLYVKRAKADQIALGSPGDHRARLARIVDLPPAADRSAPVTATHPWP
jgi:alkylation response protein AidB-like acyl-CoA dehydrogenase